MWYFPIAMVFVVVVLPIWIIAHYVTRWRTAKTLSGGEEAMLTELRETAEKMDGRMRSLERILDAEAPDWRTRT
ncbi:MAG: envelope stress response membrane protein PspB [Rhodospirillales bacterium]|jgi:phage shock protein B|nr:envelope stress response membrane protein PspB [Rhodospirillales bacterium]